jgi:hypothetical protein
MLDRLRDAPVDVRWKLSEVWTPTGAEPLAAVVLDLYEIWRLAPDYPGESA